MKKDRIISTSFQEKSFRNMNFGSGKRAVVVVGANNPHVFVLDIEGLTDDEVMNLVKGEVARLTIGCNYHYAFVDRIDNTFFFD